jgi:ferredoxin
MPEAAKRKRFRYRVLSWIRLCVALGVLVLFVRVFTSSLLQWRDVRAFLMDGQFSGALARDGIDSAVVLGWLAAVALFGRWYCSVVCPLGTAQEVVRRLARLAAGRKKISFSRFVSPWRLRYLLPCLAGVGLFLALLPLFALMDPIANFGHGVRGLFFLVTEKSATPLMWGNLAVFAVILTFAALRGRRFCDWCPVGTFLGLCSRTSLFGMKLDSEVCVSCGNCERACPMNCVDAKNKTLERERCVLCLSCAGSCAPGALDYGFIPPAKGMEERGARRTFLQRCGSVLTYLAGVSYLAGPTLRGLGRFLGGSPSDTVEFLDRVGPPGAVSSQHFAFRCIGCLACAAACPVGIIRADQNFPPQLDYTRGYCQYNCTECGHVCPTEALLPLRREEKQRTRIALSDFTRANCVVVTRGQSCGACAEVCPTHALQMVSLGDGSPLTVPIFDTEYCIGCGGCFNVCPAVPKAFVVTGISPHVPTPGMRPSEGDQSPLPVVTGDDFPF